MVIARGWGKAGGLAWGEVVNIFFARGWGKAGGLRCAARGSLTWTFLGVKPDFATPTLGRDVVLTVHRRAPVSPTLESASRVYGSTAGWKK